MLRPASSRFLQVPVSHDQPPGVYPPPHVDEDKLVKTTLGWIIPHMRVPPEEFETLVERAIDGLPEEFFALLDNVAVVVEDEPDPEDLHEMGFAPGEELLGLYRGIPLVERDSAYSALPDQVSLYRGPLLRICRDRRELIREIRDTLVHELGHHFGLTDEEMPY